MRYFVPKTGVVTWTEGDVEHSFRLRRGVQEVDDVLADHASANHFGIKPVEEMTVAERISVGLPTADPLPVYREHVSAEDAEEEIESEPASEGVIAKLGHLVGR